MHYLLFPLCFLSTLISKKENKRFFLSSSMFLLFLFSALRFGFGNDYFSYQQYFLDVHNGVSGSGLTISEIGFFYLNKLIPSFHLLLALISGVFLYLIYRLIFATLEPRYYPLALFIFLFDPYLFLISLSAIRQTIAICLFFLAVYFGMKRRFVLYVLVCLIASLFHQSAIVLILAYPLLNQKKGLFSKGYIVLIVTYCSVVFYEPIISPLVRLLLSALNNPNYWYYYENLQTNSLMSIILSSIPFFYVAFNMKKTEGNKLVFAKLSTIFYATDILAYSVPMIGRIGKYFAFFTIVALPSVFSACYKKDKGLKRTLNVYVIPALIVAIYLARLVSFFSNPMWSSFSDYKTWLFI